MVSWRKAIVVGMVTLSPHHRDICIRESSKNQSDYLNLGSNFVLKCPINALISPFICYLCGAPYRDHLMDNRKDMWPQKNTWRNILSSVCGAVSHWIHFLSILVLFFSPLLQFLLSSSFSFSFIKVVHSSFSILIFFPALLFWKFQTHRKLKGKYNEYLKILPLLLLFLNFIFVNI